MLRPYVLVALGLTACASSPASAPVDASPPTDLGAPVDAAAPVDASTPADVATSGDVPMATDAPRSFRTLAPLGPTPVRSFTAVPANMLTAGADYRATIVTDVGTLQVDLLEDVAPITVNSFVWLARNRFFEGIAFHRVIEGFVAQAGDPNTVDGGRATWGRGGPGYTFGLEVDPSANYDGPGVVGMARGNAENTNGSQFFITLAATHSLDQMYTIFGRLLDDPSRAVLAQIARGEPPATPTRITSVTILEGVP